MLITNTVTSLLIIPNKFIFSFCTNTDIPSPTYTYNKHYFFAEAKRVSILAAESILFVSYVKNNAFPQPLLPDDERKYLELIEQGDTEECNLLIKHNL
jgi:hypothetical protein